ncbi:MAG: response regulator transcription factor [Actinomycetes bacterium]
MAGRAHRVLLVEDDVALGEALALGLRAEGFEVDLRRDGLDIVTVAAAFRPDLVVLDVRLAEGPSGLGVAERLRAVVDLPIVFLTAADGLEDRLAGFRAGADDYLVKPVALAELAVRIRAILRRSGVEDGGPLTVGDLVIDEQARSVHRDGDEVELTRTEFDLLLALATHAGNILSKAQLLSMVWGFDEYDPNLVEVYVSTLRRKLELNGTRNIQTIRGVGYSLRA